MPDSKKIDRRGFLRLASAALAAAPKLMGQTTTVASLSFRPVPVAVMPLDFTGLSYESPQLANPAFFCAENKALFKLFRELTPSGVLRTGGNLSAFTCWRDDPSVPLTDKEQAAANRGKQYWEWALTDPTLANGRHEAVFTPACIEALAAFLKATGWRLLYGLNFGTGTPEQAAAEAACVQRTVGANLIGFQLGNEIDFWKGGLRPSTWEFDSYYAQWKEWTKIIRARTPGARFAGPDVAIRLDWMEQLAQKEAADIVLLSKHHYAMGPAGDPKMNAAHLLGPDPDVTKEIASAKRAKAFAGVGFRNTECGSCFHGGQSGVSNAFASALWAADYMLTLAQGGHAGINMHGGGNGFYSPIAGDAKAGFTARPLYYGMQFAQSFAGATFFESNLAGAFGNATAYVARQGKQIMVALINKDSATLHVKLDRASFGTAKLASVRKLSAPALDSLTGVTFEEAPQRMGGMASAFAFDVPSYSALLLTYTV